MAAEKAVMSALKGVMNLNSYEAKIWLALLSRGISSASELADISKVPRSRCYDVLESLEKKGFVFMKIGKPIKYIAIEPEEVIETQKKYSRIEENRMHDLMDSLTESDTFKELQDLYNTGIHYIDCNEISTSILGSKSINLFLKDMLTRASKNVTIQTTEDGVKRKLKIIKKAVGKNVSVNIHAPVVEHTKSKNISFTKKQAGMRYIQVDDDEFLFFTSPEEINPEHESAIWVKSKFATDMMKSLIN
jgi:sugar-specific transcriptional regulator TrmB